MAPVRNEAGNLEPFVVELDDSLSRLDLDYEIVIIDDNSTDGSRTVLAGMGSRFPRLRGFCLEPPPGRSHSGQSAVFREGLHAARGRLVALLDADLQNDPGDIGAMLALLREEGADMVQGDRSRVRRDGAMRKISSAVGRAFRRIMLGDTIVDTGCSLRVFRREVGLELPLQYAGIHRFIPYYARMSGYTVVEMPVRHRPRRAGRSKYGTWDRALTGLADLLAVRWMSSRVRRGRLERL
jgi:glycosyltransferase involved in cell wall biosynthesis